MDANIRHARYIPIGQTHMMSGIETATITTTSGSPNLK